MGTPPITLAAGWLDDVFAPFDLAVLGALHALAEGAGFALTPLFEAVSFVGEKGACFFALALMLMLFKRTRKAGVCVFVALCLGALASNVMLGGVVAAAAAWLLVDAAWRLREPRRPVSAKHIPIR